LIGATGAAPTGLRPHAANLKGGRGPADTTETTMIQASTLTHLADIGPLSTNRLGDWSNFLGPIEGVGAFAAGYVLARKHNCHVKGCWRIGRIQIQDTEHVVCRHHHPDDKPSHQDILDASAEAHRIRRHRAKLAREAEAHWTADDASPGDAPSGPAPPSDRPTPVP